MSEPSQDQIGATVKLWSAKLAKDFPQGMLVSFGNGENDPIYHVGRPRVLNAKGIIPKIQLQVLDVPKELVVDVVTYEVVQQSPLVAKVHGTDGEVMTWSANVPESRT